MTTNTESQDAQYASFMQRHPYVDAFLDGIPWKALPVYLGLAIAFIWLGGLTVAVAEHHGSAEAAQGLWESTKTLSLVYMAGFPALYGLVNVLGRWLEYRRGAK